MIDFPASPTIGQQFTAAGVTWTWDGAKWLPNGLAPTVVPGIRENRIINGDMRIDQRNGGASGTANGYTVDRWQYTSTQASKLTWQRIWRQLRRSPVGFPYCFALLNSGRLLACAARFLFHSTAHRSRHGQRFRLGNA